MKYKVQEDKGKVDELVGLKENVLIGKLIPAGTGMKRYRSVKLDTDVQELDFNDEIDFSDDFELEEASGEESIQEVDVENTQEENNESQEVVISEE